MGVNELGGMKSRCHVSTPPRAFASRESCPKDQCTLDTPKYAPVIDASPMHRDKEWLGPPGSSGFERAGPTFVSGRIGYEARLPGSTDTGNATGADMPGSCGVPGNVTMGCADANGTRAMRNSTTMTVRRRMITEDDAVAKPRHSRHPSPQLAET
jgi:hypothetical protein